MNHLNQLPIKAKPDSPPYVTIIKLIAKPNWEDPDAAHTRMKRRLFRSIDRQTKYFKYMGAINIDPINPANQSQFDHGGRLSGFGATEYWNFISQIINKVDRGLISSNVKATQKHA